MRGTLEERFWAKVEKTEGCWLWTAHIHKKTGYGRIGSGGKYGPTRDAHVVSYELAYGPVPEGLEVDHRCSVRQCVRPSHLEAVTHAENLRRGRGGEVARARQLAKTHCPKDHPYSGANLIIDKNGARRCRECRNAPRRVSSQP